MFPNKVYDVLKFVAQIALPAVAVLYAALAGIWNWPFIDQIPATITALVLFLGAVLQISSINYNNSEKG